MPFGFLNAVILLGLVTVVIPPIIHFFSRRRYDVVDWGAMQFLRLSERRRRRLSFEDLLLMLLRMALLAVIVLVLSAPFINSPRLARWGGQGPRDVVLIIDGSYSMGLRRDGRSTHERALDQVRRLFDELRPGDGVAVVHAKRHVLPVVGSLTTDLPKALAALEEISAPSGSVDWPAALQVADDILAQGQRARREIVILSDGQRYGWADDSTLLRWELLAPRWSQQPTPPRIWYVNVDPDRPADPPNNSLQPIRTNRPVAAVNREVTFRTTVQRHGEKADPAPRRIRVEVDGRPAGDITWPNLGSDREQIPISFTHRFATVGSHLVTLTLDDDALPGDNRQHYAIEVVPALPVLIVDGEERPNPPTRGSDFLRDALAPRRDPNPAVLARVMPITAFDASHLSRDLGDEPGTTPRVVVFCDVARLNASQQEAVERFLTDRNGVLMTCGSRTDGPFYNEQLFRGGQGWLPAKLVETVGNEDDLSRASRPVPASFFHPAVEIFRDIGTGGLADAFFPKRWRLSLAGATASIPIAMLTGGDPFLVERSYQQGRVILAAVPLDGSWRSNITELPAFVPLVHEMVFYLAGGRASDTNLAPGQPIRFQPPHESPGGELRLRRPDGSQTIFPIESWPFVYDDTREPGVYTVLDRRETATYFVVPSDTRESQLAPLSDDDRAKVSTWLPQVRYVADLSELSEGWTEGASSVELWWPVLLLACALVFAEVAFTRRIARRRAV